MMPPVVEKKQEPELKSNLIDDQAYQIVATLQDRGFATYLVGGCVRDLLVGIQPKDFDIATDARPLEVKRLINNAYIIGKRFRLVLVRRGQHQYEVSTFRRNALPEEIDEDSPNGDNFFGSPEEDAKRRDFTINGLFYDPLREELIDYCAGLRDIELRTVRMIGDTRKRLVEDPIRIFRALRMAHKLDFQIDEELRSAILEQAPQLAKAVLPRRREEILKLLRLPDPARAFLEAYDLGLWAACAPGLAWIYEDPEKSEVFQQYLARIDEFVLQRDDPAHLLAFLIFALYRATVDDDPSAPIKSSQLAADTRLQTLLRSELGMFQAEQNLVFRVLNLQHLLTKIGAFTERGERRQLALLTQFGFPLALQFAWADLALGPREYDFWLNRSAGLPKDFVAKRQDSPRRRSRKRRPRRPYSPKEQVS